MDRRPSWDKYFLDIAKAVAARADCTRRRIGCVIIDPVTHDIIQTGYNGAPAGQQGCLQGACPRGLHFERNYVTIKDTTPKHGCHCGGPWPCKWSVDPASSYDTGPGACISVHAEANALIRAGKLARGTTMYVTDEPCQGCVKLIHGAGVGKVIWPHGTWEFS